MTFNHGYEIILRNISIFSGHPRLQHMNLKSALKENQMFLTHTFFIPQMQQVSFNKCLEKILWEVLLCFCKVPNTRGGITDFLDPVLAKP